MLMRHIVCTYLEARDFAVESATHGTEALEILRDVTPDIVITDIEMPKMDGWRLIRALRERPQTAHIPIVVLTGRKHSAQEAAAVGADLLIFKNFDLPEQLDRAVEMSLAGLAQR